MKDIADTWQTGGRHLQFCRRRKQTDEKVHDGRLRFPVFGEIKAKAMMRGHGAKILPGEDILYGENASLAALPMTL